MSDDKAKIATLREEARTYRDQQNALVSPLWELSMKIEATQDETEKKRLVEEKERLDQEIKDKGYEAKFKKLLAEIEALEIKVFGHSELSGNSPFIL